MWLDVAIAMSCGGAGLVCGWIMHAISGVNHLSVEGHLPDEGQSQGDDASEEIPDPSLEQLSEVANRLQAYALSMAADVDAHQTKVQAVNHELADRRVASQQAVIRAVNDLIAANEKMQSQLKEAQDRIQEQSLQIESAERRAQTDVLTRLPNRGAFNDHVESRAALGPGRAGTLALLDVDSFKNFNDLHGHQAGDEVLRTVGSILHSRLQSHGLVARFGGEEFAIVLDGIPVEQATAVVESARIAIGQREVLFENKLLRVSASIGLAEFEPGQSIADWIQQADEALYRSKDAGRDCGHWIRNSQFQRINLGQRETTSSPALAVTDLDGDDSPGIDVSDQPEPVASQHDGTSGVGNPKSITDLPGLKWMEAQYGAIRHRMQCCSSAGESLPIVLMAIRCHDEVTLATMRGLMRVTRAAMRGVDRIGCVDDSTLLICMPSSDEAMAVKRARQISRSADSTGLGWKGIGPRPVSIGVVQAVASDSFRSLVSRAVELADEARESFSDPICVGAGELSASE